MKGIVLTTDEKMFVKDFAAPLHESLGEAVGGYIEVVHPRGLDRPYCFVCNEEGILMDLAMNIIGSLWYGTLEHGHPIVGDIVVLKQGMTDDGPDIVGWKRMTSARLSRSLTTLPEAASGTWMRMYDR